MVRGHEDPARLAGEDPPGQERGVQVDGGADARRVADQAVDRPHGVVVAQTVGDFGGQQLDRIGAHDHGALPPACQSQGGRTPGGDGEHLRVRGAQLDASQVQVRGGSRPSCRFRSRDGQGLPRVHPPDRAREHEAHIPLDRCPVHDLDPREGGEFGDGGLRRAREVDHSASLGVVESALPEGRPHVQQGGRRGGQRRGQEGDGRRRPGVVQAFARELGGKPGPRGQDVGVQPAPDERFDVAFGLPGRLRGDVGARRCVVQAVGGPIVGSRVLVGNGDGRGAPRPVAGQPVQVQVLHGVGEPGEDGGSRARPAVGVHEPELGFVGHPHVGRPAVGAGFGVDPAPGVEADGSGPEARPAHEPVVVGDRLGGELGAGRPELVDHDGPARPPGQSRLEGRRVRHPAREEAVRVQLGRVDRVGVDAGEVEPVGHDVGPEGTAVHLLRGRPDGDEVARVVLAQCRRDGVGPSPSVGVGRGRAVDPEGRLVGEVPRDELLPAAPSPGEGGRVAGLGFDEAWVGVRVDPARPRQIPVGVAHLASDEERGVQGDAVGARRVEYPVDDGQMVLVHSAAFGFDGRPQQVDARRGQAAGGHAGEGRVEFGFVHPPRPVRAGARNVVHSDGHVHGALPAHEVPPHRVGPLGRV